MIKAVIFGMNGVIYDSTPYIWKARQEYLKQKGFSLTQADTKELLGHSLQDQLHKLSHRFGIELDYDDFSEKTRALAVQFMKGIIQPNLGLISLLLDLQKNKIKLTIATLFPGRMLQEDLSILNLTDHFPITIALEETDRHKNSPDMLLKAAKRLGVKPEECVYIDDSVDGITVAKQIGMKFIGKVTQFHKAEEFKGADLVVNSLEELNADKILKLSEDA